MSALKYYILLSCFSFGLCDVCPKQCDCDIDNGLNRAICSDQNIISVGVGVPKEVQVYSLSHNAISELDNYCFKELGYTSLQVLTLSYNLIFWVGLHAFAGLDKLFHLDLSNNRLRYLSSDLFWDTPLLDVLDLSANVFESLKNEPFLIHDKLQVLNLNNCRIKSLPDRLFTRLPNLKKIDLSENYMITINLDTLRPLRKLERIELRNEYLQCNSDFIMVESWLAAHGITYKNQCQKKLPKMSEKIIAAESPPKEDVDINRVWNVTSAENTTKALEPTRTLTPLEKLDKDFSAIQAFIIGLEVGLAVGIVGTYIWLRRFCHCGQLSCTLPQTRSQRRRRVRTNRDGDMRTNLLWSNVIHPDLATPPVFRRQLPVGDGRPFPVYGLPAAGPAALPGDEGGVELDDRSETPPPPYHECHVNVQ